MTMEQKAAAPVKPKAKKEISAMRKITFELDSEVRKVEINKQKLAKFEKAIQSGNERIKALTAQLNKNLN
jgi:rRNA processing protein Krr1/Pno1